MKCDEVRVMVGTRRCEDVLPSERAAVARHMRSCASCQDWHDAETERLRRRAAPELWALAELLGTIDGDTLALRDLARGDPEL